MGLPRPDRSGLAMTQEVITQGYKHIESVTYLSELDRSYGGG
jgi:hypothetical protein